MFINDIGRDSRNGKEAEEHVPSYKPTEGRHSI